MTNLKPNHPFMFIDRCTAMHRIEARAGESTGHRDVLGRDILARRTVKAVVPTTHDNQHAIVEGIVVGWDERHVNLRVDYYRRLADDAIVQATGGHYLNALPSQVATLVDVDRNDAEAIELNDALGDELFTGAIVLAVTPDGDGDPLLERAEVHVSTGKEVTLFFEGAPAAEEFMDYHPNCIVRLNL